MNAMTSKTAALALFVTILLATGACGQEPSERATFASLDARLTLEAQVDGHREMLLPVAPAGSADGAVAIGPGGIVAVRQLQTLEVRLFDADGNSLRTVGGRGNGPGEFQAVTRIGWRGDSLWVSDGRASRITVWPALGDGSPETTTYSRSTPAQTTSAGGQAVPAFPFVHVLGVISGDSLVSTLGLGTGQDEAGYSGRTTAALMSSDGEVWRALAQVPIGRVQAGLPGGGVAVVPFPETTYIRYAAGDRQVVAAHVVEVGSDSATVRVQMAGLSGDTINSVNVTVAAFEIPARERARAEDQFRENTGVRIAAPSHYPPLSGLVVDDAGGVWVEIRDPMGERNLYYVLDDTGQLVGRVAFPEGSRVAAASGSDVWVLEKGDYDVESIVRYALTW